MLPSAEARHLAGIAKRNAARLGITPEAWAANRAAGLKWCSGCKQWQPIEEFTVDNYRGDGRRLECRRSTSRRAKQRRKT